MYDADQLVKHTRKGNPNGFESVTDTYRFDPQFKNCQVSKVIATFQPGRGYRTIVHTDGKGLSGNEISRWPMGNGQIRSGRYAATTSVRSVYDQRS